MRVADILKSKSTQTVMTVRPEETVGLLARRLRLAGVGAMMVSEDGQTLGGIVTERDVAYALPDHAGYLHTLRVSDLMTKTVITCTPEDTIAKVSKIMTLHRIRHLPAIEGGRLAGVVSIGDVLK